ncbi:hypothetical protein CAEBREN_06472 [Caenorhabditis brenneri]|uniref:SUN domain-containing protein n=1 Tax=Caenorhabditis brenneri TaxID=135651 RepID=G0P282_CAEBE|nr:hypothetical protein CAEBREN_06472 [Caenorhabditis brenneri]
MNEDRQLHRDIESAYGSDVSSESNSLRKRESFSVQEPAVEKHITTLQAQFEKFQKQVSGKDIINSKNQSETKSQNEGVKKMEDVLNELLKEVEVKPVELVESTPNPTIPLQSPVSLVSKPQVNQLNTSFTRINVASYMLGAVLDKTRSSSSNLNPIFGWDQSDLVLLDRPDPPANRAWCTYEKNPVLTVNLAKYVNITAISYQHSKWNGTIPDDAPKIYDVVACLDYYCDTWKTIAKNCEYEPDGIGQEQLCNLSLNSINSTIGKVQFRFLRNHGNIEKTCVGLVRVYDDPPKEETSEKSRICSNLKKSYHNNTFVYKYLNLKSCDIVYAEGCCTECPECCQECWIKDFDGNEFVFFIFITATFVPLLIIIICKHFNPHAFPVA